MPAPGLEAAQVVQAVQPVPGAPRPPWQVCVHLRACARAPGAADCPPGGCEGEQVSGEEERAAQDTGCAPGAQVRAQRAVPHLPGPWGCAWWKEALTGTEGSLDDSGCPAASWRPWLLRVGHLTDGSGGSDELKAGAHAARTQGALKGQAPAAPNPVIGS